MSTYFGITGAKSNWKYTRNYKKYKTQGQLPTDSDGQILFNPATEKPFQVGDIRPRTISHEEHLPRHTNGEVMMNPSTDQPFKIGDLRPLTRINVDDRQALDHLCMGTEVSHIYNPFTNDISFNAGVTGNGLKGMWFDGDRSGGQLIRTALQLAILHSGGRSGSPEVLDVRSDNKASTLYAQAVWATLNPGWSFTVKGGTLENSDAPSLRDYAEVFDLYRRVFGLNYWIVDESHDGQTQFTLYRGDDVELDGELEITGLSDHSLDQMLMGRIFAPLISSTYPKERVFKISGVLTKDFHVPTMIKTMIGLGLKITETINDGERVIQVE